MSWAALDPNIQETAERELTTRQLTVLKLWLAGQSTRRIALALNIAEPTARGHLDRAIQKMKPHIRKDAV